MMCAIKDENEGDIKKKGKNRKKKNESDIFLIDDGNWSKLVCNYVSILGGDDDDDKQRVVLAVAIKYGDGR